MAMQRLSSGMVGMVGMAALWRGSGQFAPGRRGRTIVSCKGAHMRTAAITILAMGLALAMAGCSKDRPAAYARQRPDIDSLDSRDQGLQSKDVIAATDDLARDILSLPALRQSPQQWTMVVDRVEDKTIDKSFRYNYDIFLERLRTNLSAYGGGQITLIDNRARFERIRAQETYGPTDTFQQGSGAQPGVAPINPDYALYGQAFDLPNRGTNYYLLQFNIVNLKTRQQWAFKYEVRVAR
jgi:hypothetical protein